MMLTTTVSVVMAFMVQARTITVTANKEGGETTSFNLTFSPGSADTTNSLWMAYGKADGGADGFTGWSNVKYVGAVPGDVSSMNNVALPSGWGSTVYRLRFFLTSGGDVPSGERVEYIKATGGQYALTTFMATGDSAVEMEFAFHDGYPTAKDYNAFFCSRGPSATENYAFLLYWCKSGTLRLDYYSGNKLSENLDSVIGSEKHAIHVDYSGVYLDNSETPLAWSDGTVFSRKDFPDGNRPMSLFAANREGGSINYYSKYSLYSFKAYKSWTNWTNGTDAASLELDLVPCVKHDGTVCLYNKVDGAFYENLGTGAFAAGNVVVSPTTEMESSSDLVTVELPGWITTTGEYYYPYVYPLYIVDVAAGDSKSINEVTFKCVSEAGSSVTNDVGYEAFIAESRIGTILKQGVGTLTFNKDISSFTGSVHVAEGVAIGVCSNCFGYTATSVAATSRRTYVHSGATLVMDDAGNKLVYREANAVYYEGDGYPGMGGAFVIRNGDAGSGFSTWQLGSGSRAVGPASVYFDIPSGGSVDFYPASGTSPASDFSANGQDVLFYGRSVGSKLRFVASSISGIGNLVISNMTLHMNASSALLPKNGSASTIRFRGGARWMWPRDYSGVGQTATVFVDDLGYAMLNPNNSGLGLEPWYNDGKTYNWYCGPVVLNDDFRMYNNFGSNSGNTPIRSAGCTFPEQVSGLKGFRPGVNPASGKPCGDAMRLNLLYPTNTFEGGIVLDKSALGVYGERSVPSQEGAGIVSITNGYVYFGRKVASAGVTNRWVDFTMPVTEFVGAGAVTNGTGTWKGLVKKGAGVLDYNSQLGGAYLDLQGGTVKFNTQYRGAYTGDNAGAAPDGYAAALPVFTTLKGTVGALDLAGVGGAYTVENVEGSPSVVNGNLTVTGNWTVDAATVGTSIANISGALALGEGATITVTGNLREVTRPSGGFVIARAASVTGMPTLIGGNGYSLKVVNGELKLVKGFMVIFR